MKKFHHQELHWEGQERSLRWNYQLLLQILFSDNNMLLLLLLEILFDRSSYFVSQQ